jgi:hypothetical protein
MGDSENSEIYDILNKISQGESVNKSDVMYSDDLIYDVKFNKTTPNKTVIILYFNDNMDYWKLFSDLSTESLHYASMVFSPYGDIEFDDNYTLTNDWREGYLLNEFNEDNLNTVKDILKIIAPQYYKLDDIHHGNISELLYNLFDRKIDNIITTYALEKNICKSLGLKNEITKETCHSFQPYGIFNTGDGCFYKYYTTVGILLSLYKKYGNSKQTIRKLLKTIGNNIEINDWAEYVFESECVDFDDDAFQREVSWQLSKIMDKVIDDYEDIDISGLTEKVIKIVDKYDIGVWYPLPKDKNKSFKIESFNYEEGIIIVELMNSKTNEIEGRRSYPIEDFYIFLTQPELF